MAERQDGAIGRNDAGNTAAPSPGLTGLIDMAWSWADVAWSPDGQILAAAAQSQEVDEGQIHLFDRSGHPIGAVPGFAAVGGLRLARRPPCP